MSDLKPDFKFIQEMFQIEGELSSVAPYGNGHINDTYLAAYSRRESTTRYIHQRINHNVFPDPVALMRNFDLVTGHIAGKLHKSGQEDLDRRVLKPLKSNDENSFGYDLDGAVWRTTQFIEGTTTYDIVRKPSLAYEVGRCFGEFQKLLLDLKPEKLHTTIADFHNTGRRFEALQRAIELDPINRARHARAEIAFTQARKSYVDLLQNLYRQGLIPLRIAHNDTKVNNLLIDDISGKAICVTDLDTTMPGLALHDFGDMVRTACNNAAEDERNLEKVSFQLEIFKSLAAGYLSQAGKFLNQVEKENLVFACKVIVLENGIRFLGDYLEGDVYFKIEREDHNWERAKAQFKLLSSVEQHEEMMEKVIESHLLSG